MKSNKDNLTNVDENYLMEIKKIFHSTFLIKYPNGKTILTDPFFGDNLPEGFQLTDKPTLKKEELPKIDLILLTHEHFDHYNKDLVNYFTKRDKSIVIKPKRIIFDLNLPNNQVRNVSIDDNLKIFDINIKVLLAHHPQSFYPVGYLLDYNNVKLYFAGDISSLPKTKFKTDVAIMPAGGKYTSDLFEFIAMSRQLNPMYSIPMHYNTFKSIQIDIDKLKDRAEEKLKKVKAIVLNNGESFYFNK